jgi:hypothetical protein
MQLGCDKTLADCCYSFVERFTQANQPTKFRELPVQVHAYETAQLPNIFATVHVKMQVLFMGKLQRSGCDVLLCANTA